MRMERIERMERIWDCQVLNKDINLYRKPISSFSEKILAESARNYL